MRINVLARNILAFLLMSMLVGLLSVGYVDAQETQGGEPETDVQAFQ